MQIERKSNRRNTENKILTESTHSSRNYVDGSMTLVGVSLDCKHDFHINLTAADVERIAKHYLATQA
jgi:hypothetical protein